MDDGFQSARLAVDFALVVIDTGRGIGNGHIVPGGPVRAPVAVQMRHLDAILKVGDGNAADQLVRQAARAGKQVMVAKLKPRGDSCLAGQRVLAFAGIADPGKFYRTLETIGADVVETRDFPDHHHLSDDEIDDLIAHADAGGLILATTAKDVVRLAGGHGRSEELRERVSVVDVEMVFDDPHAPALVIDQAVEAFRARRLKK